jgi:hypothetical protein
MIRAAERVITVSARSENVLLQARDIGHVITSGRAARLAGERPERVEIDPATGRITVIIAKAGEGAAGAVWGHGARAAQGVLRVHSVLARTLAISRARPGVLEGAMVNEAEAQEASAPPVNVRPAPPACMTRI